MKKYLALILLVPCVSSARFEDITQQAGINYVGETFGASWGDFNGDGYADIWVSNHANPPRLYLNNTDGTFTDIAAAVWPGNLGDTHGASWVDIDNDGDQDLLELVGGAGSNHLFINESGLFSERASNFGLNSPGARSRSPAFVDWNRDGRLDAVLTHALGSEPQPLLLTNLGSTFSDAATVTGIGEHATYSAYIDDLSEDDITDIILSTGNPNAGPIYSTSTTPFINIVDTLAISGFQKRFGCSDTVIADFNGDLRNDIFSSCGGGGREVVIRNDSLVEMRLSSVANETAVEFYTDAIFKVSVFPLFAFTPNEHLKVGANGVVPNIDSHPELGWRSFSFFLDPHDPIVHGEAEHIAGEDLGLFISFDPNTSVWRLALSAPMNRQLGVVVSSVSGTFDDVSADGFNATPAASWPYYQIRTDDGFEDRRSESGLGMPLACPSAVGGDYDNDMDVDIYLVCSRTITNLSNVLLINDGNGNFAMEPDAGGASGSTLGSGDSVITADFDRDGYLDLFVTNGEGGSPFNKGPHQLFKNVPNGNNWLQVDLVGATSNRDAIGARVTITTPEKMQTRTQNGGFHRRSQNDKRLHFGLAQNYLVTELEVHWPSGHTDTFFDIPANRIITINEGQNPDQDGDGVLDIADNCIAIQNTEQDNLDNDEYGDNCDEDIDGDGLPNTYEDSVGLNAVDATDASIDTDGDGFSNIKEFLAGTDLNDKNDFPAPLQKVRIPTWSLLLLFFSSIYLSIRGKLVYPP